MDEKLVQNVIDLLKHYKSIYNTPNFDTMIDVLTRGCRDVGSLAQGFDYMGDHILVQSDRDLLAEAVSDMFASGQFLTGSLAQANSLFIERPYVEEFLNAMSDYTRHARSPVFLEMITAITNILSNHKNNVREADIGLCQIHMGHDYYSAIQTLSNSKFKTRIEDAYSDMYTHLTTTP